MNDTFLSIKQKRSALPAALSLREEETDKKVHVGKWTMWLEDAGLRKQPDREHDPDIHDSSGIPTTKSNT